MGSGQLQAIDGGWAMSLLPPRKRAAKSSNAVSTTTMQSSMPAITDRIIRNVPPERELEQITGLKPSTIYKHIALGTFPPQQKITGKSSGWRLSEVNRWLSGERNWKAGVRHG